MKPADLGQVLVTGGGGPLHGCEVATRLGIGRVICPPSAGVASALGLLMAPARIDRVATERMNEPGRVTVASRTPEDGWTLHPGAQGPRNED